MKKHWIFLGVCMLPICLWAGDDDDIFAFDNDFSQGSGEEGKDSHEEESGSEEEADNKQEYAVPFNCSASPVSQPISFALKRSTKLQEEVSSSLDENPVTVLGIYKSIQAARKSSNNASGFGSLPVSLTRRSSRSSANPESNQITQPLSVTFDPPLHFDPPPPISAVPPIVPEPNNPEQFTQTVLPVIVPPTPIVKKPKSKLFVPKKHTSEYNTLFDFDFDFEDEEEDDRETGNQLSEEEEEEEDQFQTEMLSVLPRGVPNEAQGALKWRNKALARAGIVPVPHHTNNNGPRASSSAPIAIGVNWGGSLFE